MELENPDGTIAATLPEGLAGLLVEHRGWKPLDPSAELVRFGRSAELEVFPTSEAAAIVLINDQAAHDDDLPDGVVFAPSAYETVLVDGEKVRRLKTHCRNGHAYEGNVRIQVRACKAYRECLTCTTGRRARAKTKTAKDAQ